MAPSFTSRTKSADSRPSSRNANQASATGDDLLVPNRTSSLHSRITQPLNASFTRPRNGQRAPKTLTHAYMVCGVGREPAQWTKAPPPAQGKITHMKDAVTQFWLPEILGSSPRLDQDNEIARSLHAAMRACFPHDVEICTGNNQPHCVHHAFVLQQDSSHTLYGIALRVWSRADEKRAETIRDLRKKTDPDYYEIAGETYWIPYCLSFLSRYPLYNLLGDYLRGMWIHWNKATNLFHAEEVSRILSFPAPKLQDLVRIDMKDYALFYQFPAIPTGFQNFQLWPLFSCLNIPNIVGVVEAAVSPTSRIVLVSRYPAMLTLAAETLRFCVRVYEWSGLYVPIVHARHVRDLVQEPGPYILGVTSECRSLFTAPNDVMVVELDKNYVLTSIPPSAMSKSRRTKTIHSLTKALGGPVDITGVPEHLRSAYGGGKLIPAGEIIQMRGEVERVTDPVWWNQEAVMSVMDSLCEKLGRNSGIKAVFGGAQKKPLVTKVSTRHLNELIRERNQYSRDALEAWQDFIYLKSRLDSELAKVSKQNIFLVDELESWKQQFHKFQIFAEQLTRETQDLRFKTDNHKKENRKLTGLVEQRQDEVARTSVMLRSTAKQRDDALEALVLQQDMAEELERKRKRNKKELNALHHDAASLARQRDDAQRIVLHLRALIDGQAHHMEHIVRSLTEQGPDEAAPTPAGRPVEGDLSESRVDSVANIDQQLNSTSSGAPQTNENLDQLASGNVAKNSLKDKTDAIAYIIRNISEQCAAAVEGLQMAQQSHGVNLDNDMIPQKDEALRSEYGDAPSESSASCLEHRNSRRTSSIPPTPELVSSGSGFRSSTATSRTSTATVDQRQSTQSNWRMHVDDNIPELPATLVRSNDACAAEDLGASDAPVAKLNARNLEAAHELAMN